MRPNIPKWYVHIKSRKTTVLQTHMNSAWLYTAMDRKSYYCLTRGQSDDLIAIAVREYSMIGQSALLRQLFTICINRFDKCTLFHFPES